MTLNKYYEMACENFGIIGQVTIWDGTKKIEDGAQKTFRKYKEALDEFGEYELVQIFASLDPSKKITEPEEPNIYVWNMPTLMFVVVPPIKIEPKA